jgi:hypothetical protein
MTAAAAQTTVPFGMTAPFGITRMPSRMKYSGWSKSAGFPAGERMQPSPMRAF